LRKLARGDRLKKPREGLSQLKVELKGCLKKKHFASKKRYGAVVPPSQKKHFASKIRFGALVSRHRGSIARNNRHGTVVSPSQRKHGKQVQAWSRRFPVTEEALQARTDMEPSFPRHRGSIARKNRYEAVVSPSQRKHFAIKSRYGAAVSRHRRSIARKNRY
jgi:hypothetical protein